MKRIGLLLLWLVSPVVFGQACQGLVNCSFETPVLSGYQYNPSGAGIGWTFVGGAGIQANGSAWGAASAPDGRQTAFVQGTGSMSQTVSLNAGSYTLSFQAAGRNAGCCSPPPNIQPLRITVDGAQIGSLVTPANTSFSPFSIPFSVASGGAHTIVFMGAVSQDKTTFVDAVSVVSGGGGGTTPTTTAVASSLNPSTAGTNVVFTATVTGNAPTGSVTFTDGGNAIGGCAPVSLQANATAQCSTSGLSVGTHNIVAAYNGDTANAASTSPPLSQVVNSAPPPPSSVFTSVEIVSAPNSAVPVDALLAGSTATDADIALVPKGAGAILAQVPDGTVAGGDKRGALATDLQRARLYTDDVASGYGATISGGANSIASGMYATVVGGFDNEASGHVAVVGGHSSTASGSGTPVAFGYNANATGDSAVALGHDPVASGTDAVAIGRQNIATRDNSVAIGWDNLSDATQSMALGTQATTRSIHGAVAIAGGQIAVRGDAQRGIYILKVQTLNGTPTQLTTDAASPALSRQNVLALPDQASYAFTGRVIARDLATGDSAWWRFEGMAKRGTGPATVTQISTVTLVNADGGAGSWAFSLVGDTANGSLALLGTGPPNKTVQWVATLDTLENVGN